MDEAPTFIRIGVISDTHGLLRPEALERLRGAHHIIHAGDIGASGIVEALRTLAPTTAIRGNVDTDAWAASYPETRTLHLGGATTHVLHNLADLSPEISLGKVDVIIAGHSHRASVTTREGMLVLNPGSAGPRRFSLPVTLATLTIEDGRVTPQIHQVLP
jgi:putative phosphoesterase